MAIEITREKFNANIKREGDCWEWTGSRDKDGYGLFNTVLFNQRHTRALRVAWVLDNLTPVPKGRLIMHRCDNPGCVNPDHLKLGTFKQNTQDMLSKGRHRAAKGEDGGRAVLTEAQAKAILSDTRPYAVIGQEYGVAASTIGSIKNGVSWSHLSGERKRSVRVSPRRGVSDKITPEIVREIRSSDETYSVLAARYGVTAQTVCDIRKGRSWRHIN